MIRTIQNGEGVEALACALLEQEGEQIVRDMAGHVGDEVHGVLKRHGMLMRTTGGAVALGVLASLQLLTEAIEFGRRSMDGAVDDEDAIAAALIALFFAEAKSALPSLAREPATADVERETYRQMHDIATRDLGYTSILEALEATPHAMFDRPAPSSEPAIAEGERHETVKRTLAAFDTPEAPLSATQPWRWNYWPPSQRARYDKLASEILAALAHSSTPPASKGVEADGWMPIAAITDDRRYSGPLNLYDPHYDKSADNFGASWDGYWNDGDGTDDPETGGHWVGAVWCNDHDEWHPTRLNPTHFREPPSPPGLPTPSNDTLQGRGE